MDVKNNPANSSTTKVDVPFPSGYPISANCNLKP